MSIKSQFIVVQTVHVQCIRKHGLYPLDLDTVVYGSVSLTVALSVAMELHVRCVNAGLFTGGKWERLSQVCPLFH